jgi:hypothetical protein
MEIVKNLLKMSGYIVVFDIFPSADQLSVILTIMIPIVIHMEHIC